MSDDIIKIGKHTVRYEPETGFICVAHVGDMSFEDTMALKDAFERLSQPGKPVFTIADATQATGTSPEARKAFTTGSEAKYYLASFGANFAYRAIMNLLFKAISLKMKNFVTHAFGTEAEAREWLAAQQRREGVRR